MIFDLYYDIYMTYIYIDKKSSRINYSLLISCLKAK